ncbi:hypothetical protein SLS56_004676 [Neofusicoccum ribis]|uniref:Zn(2)-C6 fungal-type domain-containing protein n=1 Tax=Neofusicoccum ribis TaxID=45134 RepID=A0ABR3SVR2_9PEZI
MADPLSDDRARPYKSRSRRPCDFCRYKRAACLLASAPPCELCARYGKPCTFVENPAKRRRRNDDHEPAVGSLARPSPAESPHSASPDSSRPPSAPTDSSAAIQHTSPTALDLSRAPATTEPHSSQHPRSLDAETGHNAQIVGLSGESDPYLLRLYRFDADDQCSFQQLRIRNMGMSDGVPVQFMVQDNSLANKAQPGDFGKSVTAIRDEVTAMVGDEIGRRLIRL